MKSGEIILPSSNEALDFVVPHDGRQREIPIEEQEFVAEGFNNLVNDTLLAHIMEVTTTSGGENRVVLGSNGDEPGVGWKLKVVKAIDFEPREHMEAADQIEASITLERNVNGRPKEQLSYRLAGGMSGVARRRRRKK